MIYITHTTSGMLFSSQDNRREVECFCSFLALFRYVCPLVLTSFVRVPEYRTPLPYRGGGGGGGVRGMGSTFSSKRKKRIRQVKVTMYMDIYMHISRFFGYVYQRFYSKISKIHETATVCGCCQKYIII